MTPVKDRARLCPCCGRDCAHAIPAAGGFLIICGPDFGGCGATGVAGETEAEALTLWNVGLFTRDLAAQQILELAGMQHG